jgi:hypothetical protein
MKEKAQKGKSTEGPRDVDDHSWALFRIRHCMVVVVGCRRMCSKLHINKHSS